MVQEEMSVWVSDLSAPRARTPFISNQSMEEQESKNGSQEETGPSRPGPEDQSVWVMKSAPAVAPRHSARIVQAGSFIGNLIRVSHVFEQIVKMSLRREYMRRREPTVNRGGTVLLQDPVVASGSGLTGP
jgi:hypothetical protein